MTIVIKEPHKLPETREIESDQEIHGLLGGYIELVTIHDLKIYKLDLLGNEDARRLNLEPNIFFSELAADGLILGPVIICSHNDECETIGLKDFQIQIAKRWLIDNGLK